MTKVKSFVTPDKMAAEYGSHACGFINKFINFENIKISDIKYPGASCFYESVHKNTRHIFYPEKLNDIRRINKFLEQINIHLSPGDIFIGNALTIDILRRKILKNNKLAGHIKLFFIFLFKRILPKLSWTKKPYFFLTNGRNRILSRAEVLGRLVSCGFKITGFDETDDSLYFVAEKSGKPFYDMSPSYGPLFKMKRVGKGGKFIYVYKFRTMYPYSEYLQDYIIQQYGYAKTGKPSNDFRLTGWGKFLRRYWLDELPQLLNVLQGSMNIVGVRPVSERFLSDYPDDLRELRARFKPGCIPPYVALLKQEINEYFDSERIYLNDKIKHPYTADIKYFFKAFFNIITGKIRGS